MASGEVKVGKWWLSYGYSFRRVGFGFSIDRYTLQIDLIFFWVGLEF